MLVKRHETARPGALRPILFLFALLIDFTPANAETHMSGGAFGVDDYFRIVRIAELALSSDGKTIAYVAGQGGRRAYYIQAVENGAAVEVEALADARQLVWMPEGRELAFLRPADGVSQVFSYDVDTGAVRQLTKAAHSVVSFMFAPDGERLAYATRDAPDPAQSLYDRFRNADTGILIDPDTTSSHDFLNPDWNSLTRPPPPALWVAAPGGGARRIPVPGEPVGRAGTYFWSSDGRALSVVYVGDDVEAEQFSGEQTSLGVYEMQEEVFRAVAKGSRDKAGVWTSYSGGEWIPGARELLLRKTVESDPWVSGSFPQWAVADANSGRLPPRADWKTIELYPRNLRFFPVSRSTIFVENTIRGVHSLFRLTDDGLTPSFFAADFDGSASGFQFNAAFERVVFIGESLTAAPEIYTKTRDAAPVRLTALNARIARAIDYKACEVRWRSGDGIEISGWLLAPRGTGPWPLVAHVHGGPAFPYPNAFAPYFDIWPYPLEAYASQGVAVFLPNYRGTHTYGREIASGSTAQAVDDIVSGVRRLVKTGIADPRRLGVSGHSHGAVVGPLAMTREKNFRAASFAEGVANSVVMYELMSGAANRQIHDSTMGASLYDRPDLYLAESPDMYFDGVATASLFEAGAKTAAIFMFGFPKAADRAGAPNEFIIYPKTGHNIVLPHLKREAAERNLDWFRFWLLSEEDPDPAKAEQYGRWRGMRAGDGNP